MKKKARQATTIKIGLERCGCRDRSCGGDAALVALFDAKDNIIAEIGLSREAALAIADELCNVAEKVGVPGTIREGRA